MSNRNSSSLAVDSLAFYIDLYSENLTSFEDPSNIDNRSNISTSDAFWLDDRCNSFQFFNNTIVVGALCLFGIATNVLSIIVLGKDRHNHVATFLLRSLAVSDISVLAIVFIVLSVFVGTVSIPGVYENYTGFVIPYLKKVSASLINSTIKKLTAPCHDRAITIKR